jgi:hypothetical protein
MTDKTKRPQRKGAGKTKTRLGPGQLDGLVLSYMRKHGAKAPHTAGAIGRGTGHSAGAIAPCLVRLAEAGEARLAQESPRAYDLPQGDK